MVAVDPSFCPTCGSALETRNVEGRDRAYCRDCEVVVWRNPVPTAGVAVVERGDPHRVLLVRRAHEPDAGEWGIPAGFLEHDERAEDAAARELREETGLDVDPDALDLLAVDRFDHPTGRRLVTIGYVVPRDRTIGDPTPGSDAREAAFWSLDALDRAGEPLRAHDHDRVRRAFDRV
ncbi:NUDIX hydrolase [Salinigranum sp. GCM10025319]|uniref:NUDIX hydrolase n=1 Tax=Salinigranum sp. GCM10025319 TaxID=3252687 RepID=UPI0036095D9B